MQVFTSRQRLSGETTSDFHNVFTPARKLYGKSLKFKTLQISDSVFNVGSWSLDVDAVAIPMVPGVYDITTLASMLTLQINNTMGAGTVLVSAGTSSTLLTFTFLLAPHALNFSSGASASRTNKIWKVAGFTTADGLSAVDSAAALVHTSPYPTNFTYTNAFFITIEIDYGAQTPIDIGSNYSTCSFIVPMTSVIGSLVKVTESDIDFTITPSTDVIKSIRFIVRDEDGNTVDLHNVDWWMVFQLI